MHRSWRSSWSLLRSRHSAAERTIRHERHADATRAAIVQYFLPGMFVAVPTQPADIA
jgi:hypothetical protein